MQKKIHLIVILVLMFSFVPMAASAAPAAQEENVVIECTSVSHGWCDETSKTGEYFKAFVNLTSEMGILDYSAGQANFTYLPDTDEVTIHVKWTLHYDIVGSAHNRPGEQYRFEAASSWSNEQDFPWPNTTGDWHYDSTRQFDYQWNPWTENLPLAVEAQDTRTYPTTVMRLYGYVEVWTGPYPSNCDGTFLTLTSDTYDIDPTIETPVGTVGDPEPVDEQIYPTLIDQIYRVEIAGGPWNDGTDDRDDVAVSWDGTTWEPFNEMLFMCMVENQDGNVQVGYLTAESETFHIRVNDTAGNFADNTNNPDPMTYTIGIAIQQAEPSCDAQFSYDEGTDLFASVDVIGNDEDGTLATSSLEPGEWYAIVVASGSWQDEGAAPDRYDMEYYNGPDEFALLDVPYSDLAGGNQNTWCQSEDGKISYIQAKDLPLWLRVNDPSGDFTNNTGTLGVSIYHAAFTRTLQTCELTYNKESLISTGDVNGNQEGGKVFAFALGTSEINYTGALIPGAWYYLETTGGPWQWKGDGHSPNGVSFDMAISEDGETWGPLLDWTRPDCVTPIDGLGHVGAYFQIPEVADVEWKLRVDDSSTWYNNGGSMTWNLYGASKLKVDETPENGCDFKYDPDHPVGGDWVDANAEEGEFMPVYSGNFYAVEIQGSLWYWQEQEGGDHLYGMQISNDDGETWSDVTGFGGSLCYVVVGNNTIIYIKTGQNQSWRMRVDSDSFANNLGGMGYKIYAADPGDTLDPWTNCFDGNVAYTLNSLTYIPVKDEEGIYINGTNILAGGNEIQMLQPTETYKLQIEEGPWDNGEALDSYNADISSDNGVTWYAIDDRENPDIICADTDFAGLHKSVYFTVVEGQQWKIRVGDEEGAFTDNGGNLGYSLYSMAGADVPAVDVTIPMSVVNNVCNGQIIRPTSLLDVSKWVEYARMGIQRYFAWCPKHTNIIMELFNSLKTKEPFATLVEWDGMIQNVKSEVGSYTWDAGSGTDFSVLTKSPGESFGMFQEYVFAPVENDNPWETGILDISDFENFEMPASYTSCQDYLAPQAGRYLAQGVCYASSIMLMTGASFWIQLLLDLGIGILCIKSFFRTLNDSISMATGVALLTNPIE